MPPCLLAGQEDSTPQAAAPDRRQITSPRRCHPACHNGSVARTARWTGERQLPRRCRSVTGTVLPSDELDTARPTGTTLADAAEQYLKNARARKAGTTYGKYCRIVSAFLKSCKKEFVEQVDRRDVMDFMDELHEAGDGGRTMNNKTIIVLTFLKTFKVSGLLLKQDWPEYINADKRPYEVEKLSKFFAACTPDEFLLFQFFLGTGFRDQEVRVAK